MSADADGVVVRVQAIEFVQMQRDDELWELLISLAIGSADLTGVHFPGMPCSFISANVNNLLLIHSKCPIESHLQHNGSLAS
jgi:hypothetical protein